MDQKLYEQGKNECDSAGAQMMGLVQALLEDDMIPTLHTARASELVFMWKAGMAKRAEGLKPQLVLVDPQATPRFDAL